MNPIFAAGLFENPWVVAAIVIIGAFINWLSQLRQQKQQREEEKRAREAQPEPPQAPSGEFDLEETLKRWLGETTQPAPAPPPLPPSPTWQGRVPPSIVPPGSATMPRTVVPQVSDAQKQAAARLAQATGQVRETSMHAPRVRRGRGTQWSSLWRDRSSVRRAFVSSLVFGPPKGLES